MIISYLLGGKFIGGVIGVCELWINVLMKRTLGQTWHDIISHYKTTLLRNVTEDLQWKIADLEWEGEKKKEKPKYELEMNLVWG